MNSNCIYLKQKLNRTLYCKKLKKDILISQCSNCKYKEYKNSCKQLQTTAIKKKTNKLAKMERDRFSILTNDLDHCIVCGIRKENLHEIYFGKNRLNSIKYGCVIPLCSAHHIKIHNDIELDLFYKKIAQKRFMALYNKNKNDFVNIFKRNYL